jgi:hypothetical protein
VSPDVVFHFDPICPWTWMTSRWLTEVAQARSLTIGWRALSLRIVNEGEEGRHAPADASYAALRVVEALAAEDAHDVTARLYRDLGERVHRHHQTLTPALVESVLEAVAVPAPAAGALHDRAWDPRVEEATAAAVAAAGGGVGSPVISWPTTSRAVYGPIVSPPPTGNEALELWDVVRAAVEVPTFYELKRGRAGRKPDL